MGGGGADCLESEAWIYSVPMEGTPGIMPSRSPSATPFGFWESRQREPVEEQVLPKATQKVECQSQRGDRPDANESLVARGRMWKNKDAWGRRLCMQSLG